MACFLLMELHLSMSSINVITELEEGDQNMVVGKGLAVDGGKRWEKV